MCDGVEDCPLGDDELPSLCSKFLAVRHIVSDDCIDKSLLN